MRPNLTVPGTCLLIVLLLLVLLCGCQDLAAVREFTALRQAMAEQMPVVAATALDTCMERQRYLQVSPLTAFDPRRPYFDRAAAEKVCEANRLTAVRLASAFSVIPEYLQSLGGLAGEKVLNYDQDLLKQALGGAGRFAGLSADQGQPVARIAGIALDNIANFRRRRHLSRAIRDAQPHFIQLCDSFSGIVTQTRDLALRSQKDQLDSLYLDVPLRHPGQSPVVLAALYDLELSAIETQRARLTAFLDLLESLKQGHTLLDQSRDALTAPEAVKALTKASADIRRRLHALAHPQEAAR